MLPSWLPSWLPFSKSDPGPAAPEADGEAGREKGSSVTDFDATAQKVEDLQDELASAHEMCEQASLQFGKYRIDFRELRQSLNEAESSNAILVQRADEERRNFASNLVSQRNNFTAERNRLGAATAAVQDNLNVVTVSLQDMTRRAGDLDEQLVNTKFDLEQLKCMTGAGQQISTPSKQALDAPLPAQPFVVVLVDGDAYQWARDLYKSVNPTNGKDHFEPGGLAATKLRLEVIKYILNQEGQIPVFSKIMARVFFNGESVFWFTKKHSHLESISAQAFGIQFTEKMPLFDCFDSGRGKERVDDKIRENFHLYLSTPNCHAVFVAACTDNGFARMLEQYTHHPEAYQKIILVSPGFMGLEIQKLNFKHTSWPSVFESKTMPPEAVLKQERELKKQQIAEMRATGGLFVATTNAGNQPGVWQELQHLVPHWNLNEAMSNVTHHVGVRAVQKRLVGEERSGCGCAGKLNDNLD